jgi:hypothetical protein
MSSTSKAETLNLIPDKPTGSDDVMTILATVEHYRANVSDSGFPWTILPVVSEAMPLKQAMDAAVNYAKANGVYAIFVNQDGFSSEAEKRQSDTKAMKTAAPKQD